MALKGNVKDFNIEEIIQFISSGKKTGSLEIENGNENCSIYFKDGLVYFVSRTSRPDSITRRVIDDAELPQEIKEKISSGAIFPPSKHEASSEAKEKITKIVLDQVTDSVADIISWPQGEFVFKSGEEVTREYWGVGIDSEVFISEARKRSEVYDYFYKFVRSIETPLRLKEKVNQDEDIILTGKEWSFLCSLVRNGSIKETMNKLNITLTSALLAATSLLEKGLVEPVKERTILDEEEKESVIKEKKEKEEKKEEEKQKPVQEEKAEKEKETSEVKENKKKEKTEIEKAKPEDVEKEAEEPNLIDELAAITGDFEIKTTDGEKAIDKSNLTKKELMEILKTLKKL